MKRSGDRRGAKKLQEVVEGFSQLRASLSERGGGGGRGEARRC